MPNRILKDSIWDSSTLAALPDFIEDQYPRWLLLADDWGCFCADADSIKGKVYPKRLKVTAKTVEEIRLAFYEAGLLFCWAEGERVWGYWVNFGAHNYLTSVDDDGARQKLRRRTPEPPPELLAAYLKRYGKPEEEKGPRAAPWDIAGQDAAARDKTANSDSDPDLDSDSGIEEEEVAPVTPEEMLEAYEAERGAQLPQCRVLSESRRSKCRSRISERNKDPAAFREDFRNSIRKAATIPFLTGAGNRGWKADFDWFIENDRNYLKVLEGKYDGIAKQPESPAETKQRRTREASLTNRIFGPVDGQTGSGVSPGNHNRDEGDVSGRTLRLATGPPEPGV